MTASLALAVALLATIAAAAEGDAANATEAAAPAPAAGGVPAGVNCDDGLIVPIWKPYDNLSMGDRLGRGLLYILLMVYLFIGVSIVSDRFMESIETITASEKEVTVKDPKTGKNTIIVVRVWNETVANLTLMALGSSAPEILLSVVEIFSKGFKAGDLGPGTIVGSAAFNLFMIIGLCMYVIPDDEVRKIKHLRVFLVTASWSVFAYIWLYLILGPISYGKGRRRRAMHIRRPQATCLPFSLSSCLRTLQILTLLSAILVLNPSLQCEKPRCMPPPFIKVETWEGLLTFAFFPITVGMAYVAERRLLCYKWMGSSSAAGKIPGSLVPSGKDDIETRGKEKFVDDLDDMGRSRTHERFDSIRFLLQPYIQKMRFKST